MPDGDQHRPARVARAGTAALEPLYPAARLVKGGPPPTPGGADGSAGASELARVLASAHEQLESARARLEREMPRAALALARRVLEAEFAVRPERIVDLVRSGIRAAHSAERIEVYVHPSHLARLKDAMASLARESPGADEVRIESDPSLPPSGVRLQTEMGAYFAGLEDRLRRLEARVVESLAREGGGA